MKRLSSLSRSNGFTDQKKGARRMKSFDEISNNIAEVVERILSTPRDRARRIELIKHQLRR